MQRLVMLPKDKCSYQKWEHEIKRGDCYVALHKTGRLTGYRSKWSNEEFKDFAQRHGVYFDSHFDLADNPVTFFLEVDMGTEYWEDELNVKVAEYAGLMMSMPDKAIYCLFVAETKEGQKMSDRLRSFSRCFQAYGRGQRFLVTPVELFLDNPLGEIWASDQFSKPASLTALS